MSITYFYEAWRSQQKIRYPLRLRLNNNIDVLNTNFFSTVIISQHFLLRMRISKSLRNLKKVLGISLSLDISAQIWIDWQSLVSLVDSTDFWKCRFFLWSWYLPSVKSWYGSQLVSTVATYLSIFQTSNVLLL